MIEINNKPLHEIRCKCNKLICYADIEAGIIAFDCPRCHERNVFNFKYLKSAKLNSYKFIKKVGE